MGMSHDITGTASGSDSGEGDGDDFENTSKGASPTTKAAEKPVLSGKTLKMKHNIELSEDSTGVRKEISQKELEENYELLSESKIPFEASGQMDDGSKMLGSYNVTVWARIESTDTTADYTCDVSPPAVSYFKNEVQSYDVNEIIKAMC